MWIDRILTSSVTRGIELSARFIEDRHRVLVENVANIDTPGYASKRLDPRAFQTSLKEAIERADAHRAGEKRTGRALLDLRGNAQFTTDSSGNVEMRPEIEPAANILFHDGTNVRLETLMSEVADNSLWHQFIMNQLRGRYEGVLKAIRGRI